MTSENKEEPAPKSHRRGRHRENGFEQWGGYMASKKMKLAAQFDAQRQIEAEDQGEVETDIFKGVAIYVNGYTKPPADKLKRLMMIHGGIYHQYYSTTKTTHTIASNLPNSKIRNLKSQIVVKPDWVTDSIKAKKLLPYQDYLLYSPEFTHKQQTLKLKNLDCSEITQNTSETADKCNLNFSPSDHEESGDFHSENASELPENFNYESEISNAPVTETSTALSPFMKEGPVTAGEPGFLSEFYSHSRLHHISTAGQELKRYVQTLVDSNNSLTFAGRDNLKVLVQKGVIPILQNDNDSALKFESQKKNQQIIMHLDMDCFFVSVGLRKHPELRGTPVAVTHSKGKRGGAQDGSDIHFEAAHYMNQSKKKVEGLTSVHSDLSNDGLADEETSQKSKISKYSKEYGSLSEIASCSYEARKAGIRNGMFLGEALRRCPNLKTIPYDFEGYSEVSKQLYDIVASYTLDIEAVSCDELFIDCTHLLQEVCVSPMEFVSVLRAEIEQKTGCTASAGLGPNMLLARLANRVAKPNGQYYVSLETVEDFIVTQNVRDLPGVGYTTSAKFEHQGVVTCGDLQSWSLAKLQQEFGPKTGQALFNRCRGKDDRVVQLQKERKSVSAEINYGIRFEQEEEVYKFLKELSIEVANRLCHINAKGKSITLKLMIRHPDAPAQTAKFMGHGVCDHISKSVMLKSATDDPACIGNECCVLARSLKIKPEDYRGIGIQLSKLESNQKDTRGHKTIETFLCSNASKNETDGNVNQEIFAPKDFAPANKSLPKGASIKDFLSDKASPSKQQAYRLPVLSLEELDQSVLNALPKDLQKEVLEMYGTKPSVKPPSLMSHSNASAFYSSSKSKQVTSKKSSFSHLSKKSEAASKQNTLYNCFDSCKRQSSDGKEETVLKKKSATIGGAENINEVRSLVKEWVLSSQVVLDEDIDQFKDYILQVIDEDLKKVDLVLKYFHRVVSTANTMWQQAYLTVLSYVQQKMLQKFGTMLDAKSDFST